MGSQTLLFRVGLEKVLKISKNERYGMKRKILGLFLVIGILFTVSCKNHSATSYETLFPWYPAEIDNRNLQTISITSEENYRQRHAKIYGELLRIINSGDYNIISVKTTYSNEYLIDAKIITYNFTGIGEGHNVRFLLITSHKNSYPEAEKEVSKWLEETERWMNKSTCAYEIVKIQRIHAKGYFIAAEVYCRVKKN